MQEKTMNPNTLSEMPCQPPIALITSALAHAGEDQQLMERLSLLETRRITSQKQLPTMQFLFRLFGKPCFPRGELIAITGKPKSGKTFVCSILMALCQCQEVLGIVRESPQPLRVLWYDTEQSDESTQDILCHRIMPMIRSHTPSPDDPHADSSSIPAERDDQGLIVFNVRQDAWHERMPLLETAIQHYQPDFVILDGIRDLVNDINDGVLAQEVVERLMQQASSQRCCIACILHQNKSAEDKNLRGCIGTELTHKAFEVYECTKSDERVFSLCQKLTRKYDITDTLKYVVDEQGIPQLAAMEQHAYAAQPAQPVQPVQHDAPRPALNPSYITEWKGRTPIFDLHRLYADVMPLDGTRYDAREVQQKIMMLTHITSHFFYNSQREQALSKGIIVKVTNEFGHTCYYRPPKSSQPPAPPPSAGKPAQLDLFTAPPGGPPF